MFDLPPRNASDTATLERVVLEVERVGVTRAVAKSVLSQTMVCRDLDVLTGDMIISVIARVAAETLVVEEVRYPLDWWQAFRLRWLPRWWLRRWPVKYAIVRIEAKAYYPLLALPEQQHKIVLSRLAP